MAILPANVGGLTTSQSKRLSEKIASDYAGNFYTEHLSLTSKHRKIIMGPVKCTEVHIFRGVVKCPNHEMSTRRATEVIGDKQRYVWEDETVDKRKGWKASIDFPSTAIMDLLKCYPDNVMNAQEADKFIVREDGSVSCLHTDFTRQGISLYPGVTVGWAKIWVIYPMMQPGDRNQILADLRVCDPNSARNNGDGSNRFFEMAMLPYTTVLVTYPGDLMFLPVGLMHNVMTVKIGTLASDLCVSGAVHIVLRDDLEHMRHVVMNNPRLGVAKKQYLGLIKSYAEHFEVLVPQSTHFSRKTARAKQTIGADSAKRARDGKYKIRSSAASITHDAAICATGLHIVLYVNMFVFCIYVCTYM
jgi:hypothetical protein